MAKSEISLLLDSGAFSAWKRDEDVNLKNYISYIKEHEELLFAYVNLDVIPGSPKAPKADPEAAAKASDRNLQIMLDAGIRPMPVYHQYEDFKWLAKMMNDGHDYIGISPSDKAPTSSREVWLDRVYKLLCDKQGRPYVKTHGFGVTSPAILNQYPFYSADSTTWLMLSGHGRAFFSSKGEDGLDDFTRQVHMITSVDSSRTRGPQLNLLGPHEELAVRTILEEWGLRQSDIATKYQARAYQCIHTFEKLVNFLHKNPVRFERKTSHIEKPPPITAKLDALRSWKMKLFYVAWASKAHWLLTQYPFAKLNNRLLSYFHTRDWSDKDLEKYLKTGLIGGEFRPRSSIVDWRKPPKQLGRVGKIITRRADLVWHGKRRVEDEKDRTARKLEGGSPSAGQGRPRPRTRLPVV